MLMKRSISMDSNGCGDMNHPDVDVRLPPRKRLLAGLKKQSCSGSTSQSSPENNPSPRLSTSLSPSNGQSSLSEFDLRLNNLLKSYKNGANMSPEVIALAAKSAADAAAKAAEIARSVAAEKADIAAKAMEAAKNALNLVACDETSIMYHKKNKLTKHLPVQLLYNDYLLIENCGADDEFGRKLHRDMDISPQSSKYSSGSKFKNKSKKPRICLSDYKSGVSNGTTMKDRNVEGRRDFERSNEENLIKADQKVSQYSKDEGAEVDSGEAEWSYPKEISSYVSVDLCINGRTRKRGRIKQKKLPLSICSSKDLASPDEELNPTNSLVTRARISKSTARHLSLLPVEPSADNVMPTEVALSWKCEDFKVSQCIKQDKLVKS